MRLHFALDQSDQLGGQHCDDQARVWFTGEYHPMLYARKDVEREAEARPQPMPG